MSSEEQNLMKKKLLDMLCWYHEFCVNNNLKYYAVGGTLLGMARHQGFIPWDDDIDVAMPRPDYERLKQYVNQDNRYIFEFPGNAKDYGYPYCKLYDSQTTLVENVRYRTKRGIFIDIFPLDGLGNTKEVAERNFLKVDFWVNLYSTRVCAIRRERAWYKNLAIFVMRWIPDFIMGDEKILKRIEMASTKHSYEASEYIANCVGNWHLKEVAKKSFFGEPRKYVFEGMEIYGPEDFESYLTGVYGDWRKLPPVEKQISHHDFLELDLRKPYNG